MPSAVRADVNDAAKSFDTQEATALLKSSYRSGWDMARI